jgi:hypothetical protein
MENSTQMVEFGQNFQDFQLHKISTKKMLSKITRKTSNFVLFSSNLMKICHFSNFIWLNSYTNFTFKFGIRAHPTAVVAGPGFLGLRVSAQEFVALRA